jgi:hypothetical protein
VDPMFQNEALESFLRKQRNIQKIQWQDGIYDRLANSQQDMESAKGLKDVRIWQLRGDVDVHMKFLALFQMEQQYGSPKPDFYIKVYEGASDTNDLEELYDKFRYHPPSGYTGHGLSISDVEVQYSGGVTEKLKEHFESPEHAINVIRRMLHVSGMVLDDASPSVLGHLSKNIRIAVLKTPLVDEDVGVAASIRIVNPQSMKKQDFIKGGTATSQMLDFLSECIRYGISVCVAGATSSGKTTLLGWLLTTIPDGKRIYSIENGSRLACLSVSLSSVSAIPPPHFQ